MNPYRFLFLFNFNKVKKKKLKIFKVSVFSFYFFNIISQVSVKYEKALKKNQKNINHKISSSFKHFFFFV